MGKKGPRDISKQRIWNDRYRVHSYEVGPESTVRLSSLCNYLQESAWKHVNNTKYIEWIVDGFPLDKHKSHSIRKRGFYKNSLKSKDLC